MCDAGDIVDAATGAFTFGGSYAYKELTGSDLPTSSLLKGVLTTPKIPKLDAAKPPPPPVDPTEILIRNALAAERRRQGGMGSSFLTGPGGLKTLAPTLLPKASGW